MFNSVSKKNPIIAWWSGGITSAVTCKLCIDWFGVDRVRVVFIDTYNEDLDTYRFMRQCCNVWNCEIENLHNGDYISIQDVWRTHLSLNISKGAVCSDRLKSVVRRRFEKENKFSYQAFGFDIGEVKRAMAMKKNHPDSHPIFPLIIELLSKKECIKIIQDDGIEIPAAYRYGFNNNNCLKTGCVQGGIGYWQKMAVDFPEKFEAMSSMEHELTDKKGEPVTMLKDQGKDGGLVFLKPHPSYPSIKDISMMKGRPPRPLFECNGFCGVNDLSEQNETDKEINYQQ